MSRVIYTTELEQINYTSDNVRGITDCCSEVPTRLSPTTDSKVYSKEDSLRSVKKQLFGFAYRNERPRDECDFSSPKRLRMDTETEQLIESNKSKHPFAMLEESSPIVTNKPRILKSSESSLNPFSVSRQSPKTSPGGSSKVLEDVRSLETNLIISDVTETDIENSIPMGHVDSTPLVSTSVSEAQYFKRQRDSNVDTQSTSNFMTSNDFINPHPSLKHDSHTGSSSSGSIQTTASELTVDPLLIEEQLLDRGSQSKHSEAVLISRSKSVDVGCSCSTSAPGGWFSARRASLAQPKGGKSRVKGIGELGYTYLIATNQMPVFQ